MHAMDLYPTFLAAAGAKPDPSGQALDGVDLLPAWTGTGHVPGRTLFWEWRAEGSHQLAAMAGSKKLVITEEGKPELFDVEDDPAERRNVAATHPALVKDLNEQLKAWLATERREP
jgi:arylsulfatase A-like enzyme